MFIDKDLLGQQEDIELFNNIGCLPESLSQIYA
jgi:hypothetical protein